MTKLIKSAVKKKLYKFHNSPEGLNVKDPHKRWRKKMRIKYRIDGKEKFVKIPGQRIDDEDKTLRDLRDFLK